MDTQILEYGDWLVKSTANMYQVCSLNYDENTFIGIRKQDVNYILEASLVNTEPQLVAILFASILYARKTVKQHHLKFKRLKRDTISNGLRRLFSVNTIYSYDTLLMILSEDAKPYDVEELLESDNPISYLEKFAD